MEEKLAVSNQLDPNRDWELRSMEQTLDQPPVIGQLTFRYGYGEEVIPYTDSASLLEALKDGLYTMGPNSVSVKLFSDDVDLHYQVFAQEADEYGLEVDKEKYISLAQKHGLKSPELAAAIIENTSQGMDLGPSKDNQLQDLVERLEQSYEAGGTPIGKITFHAIGKEISYSSPEQLERDYLDAIKEVGAGSFSADLLIEDHELSFRLEEADASDLGFNVDREKYMELIAKYGQGSPELSQAIHDQEWMDADWEQASCGEMEQ